MRSSLSRARRRACTACSLYARRVPLWFTAALLFAPLLPLQDPADAADGFPPVVVEQGAVDPADLEDAREAEPEPKAAAPVPEPPGVDPADLEDEREDEPEPKAAAPALKPPVVDPADLDDGRLEPAPQRRPVAEAPLTLPDLQKAPRDELRDDDGDGEEESLPGLGVLLGSGAGYAVGGAVPACGLAAGGGVLTLSVMAAQNADTQCDALFIAIFGALIATAILGPSTLACGPCSSVGAAVGSGIGAASSGRELLWPILGALPGVVAGVAGSSMAMVGVLVAANTGEGFVNGALGPGCAVAAAGLALAALAGPIAIAGASFADVAAFSDTRDPASAEGGQSLLLPARHDDGAFAAVPGEPALAAVAY